MPLYEVWTPMVPENAREALEMCRLQEPLLDAAEEWRPIPGYERYEVSNYGRFRRVMLPFASGGKKQKARLAIALWNGHRRKHTMMVHRVVALAFLGPRPQGMEINHKDGNPNNNRASNLEYLTPAQNRQHAVENRLFSVTAACAASLEKSANRTSCHRGHLINEQNTYTMANGWRRCRVCDNLRRISRHSHYKPEAGTMDEASGG